MANCEHLRVVLNRENFRSGDIVILCCTECGYKEETKVGELGQKSLYVPDKNDGFYHKVGVKENES